MNDTSVSESRFGLTHRSDTIELYYKAVTRVIETLSADPYRTLNINQMARIAYISPYHFIRVFHAVTGVAPCKFQWALKLHTAKELLLSTSTTIVDISMEVGYNSLGTFTRRFTELVGLSPNRFRQAAMTVAPCVFDRLARETGAVAPRPGMISGQVHVPPGFLGTVIVACFATSLCQGRPLTYAWCDTRHRFHLERPQPQEFHLRAFGLHHSANSRPWFTDDQILRGDNKLANMGIAPTSADGEFHDVILRHREAIDAPILLSLGVLALNRLCDYAMSDEAHGLLGSGPGFAPLSSGKASSARDAA